MQPDRIAAILDLDRYPLHAPEGALYRQVVDRCRARLAAEGMFDLEGFVHADALARCIAALRPEIDTASFVHQRRHNIYFRDEVEGLAPDHPALRQMDTVNRTLCADQMRDSPIAAIYEWAPLRRFLAEAMAKRELFLMDDDLARINVMSYRDGAALNWHFDRSEFTTTLLLQAPDGGGEFEFRRDLRSDDDPNYDGVARLLAGADRQVSRLALGPGTLNVFKGRNTAHRVTPVRGARERIIAVFSYYERPGVVFTREERIGFYGRS